VDACPTGAIYLVEGIATIDAGRCDACGACVDVCPHEAITIDRPSAVEVVPMQAPLARPAIQPVAVQRPSLWAVAWPSVGAALAFAAREVVPRVVNELLTAWDRRASQPTPTDSALRARPPVDRSASTLGQRRRRRRRGGNRSRE